MKILVIGHPLVVDVNRSVWNEVGKHDGVELDMVVPYKWKSNLIKNLTYKNNPATDSAINSIIPLKCYLKGNGSFYFFEIFKLFNTLIRKKYDVIVLTQETWSLSLLQLKFLRFFSKNRDSKFFLWVCQNIKKKKLFSLRFFERFNTSSLTNILCCCSEIEDVIKWKGIQIECKYFPFSFNHLDYQVNTKVFVPEQVKKELTVGYIGRVSEEKGISLIIQMLDILNLKGIKLKLIAVGAGPLQYLFENDSRVEFRGIVPHDKAYEFYRDIDILLLPSQTRPFWKEQFGRVIIEAVASGCPVVGSSSGAIPEVLGRIGMPYVFQEDSVESFVENIEKARNDLITGAMDDVLSNARIKVYDLFTHEQVAKRFLSFTQNKDEFNDL